MGTNDFAARMALVKEGIILDGVIKKATAENRIKLLVNLLITEPKLLHIDSRELLDYICTSWIGDCSKLATPEKGSYPVICWKCAEQVGTSFYSSHVVYGYQHPCKGFITGGRQPTWQLLVGCALAARLNTSTKLIEHYIVNGELDNERRNKQQIEHTLSGEHFRRIDTLDIASI